MNIKIKKKILVCMLWLCAIACFTGFPWIFFSWDVIHSYMGIHDIPSDLTIVLFREECLFFGFFCIYFLFLRNIEKYKGLISFCSFLVAFMGGFMYLLKLQTGIVHISSDYEPFIWLIIGSFIFYLNHSINGIAPKKQKLPVLSCLFQVQAGVLLLNIVNILVPEQTWEKAGLKYIFSGELIRVFETKLRTQEVVFTLPFFLLPEIHPVERIFHFVRGILIIP